MSIVIPMLIGVLYVTAASVIREPHRLRFNAIMVAGAGAAYLSSGGFGRWEVAFTAAMTYCAYRGLTSYRWIGVAWLLHTGWDVLHYLRGVPILTFAPHSSYGCAICDPVIALWCFGGGRDIPRLLRDRIAPGRFRRGPGARSGDTPATHAAPAVQDFGITTTGA
jgi:hypothetical protein